MSDIQLSVVIPFFNEEAAVLPLLDEVISTLAATGLSHEVVCVNDGSTDETEKRIAEATGNNANIRLISLVRNYGQTAAMVAGFDAAEGDIIVAMDGDGQNDPADIPRLLDKLEEGFDVVSGWRVDRQDANLSRKIPSRMANALISRISGVRLNDYGCSLKAYRARVLKGVGLYGEMHRFVPIYTAWQGGKVGEISVNHRTRKAGRSKYGLERVFKVLLDLTLIVFLERYLTKPIYIFGGAGIISISLSVLCAIWAVYFKIFGDKSFIETPLPILVGTFFTTGVMCLLLGVIAEIMIRTYFESGRRAIYLVKQFDSKSGD